MKVYFEESGGGPGFTWFDVYVKPTRDGGGYQYNRFGKLEKFWYTDPEKANVFDSSELPKELWISIQHGTSMVELPDDKEFSFESLKYNKVDLESIQAYVEVCKRLKNVKTLDDFKKLFPLIKKGNTLNNKIMDTFFNLINFKPNILGYLRRGEIGMALFQKSTDFKTLIKKYHIDNV